MRTAAIAILMACTAAGHAQDLPLPSAPAGLVPPSADGESPMIVAWGSVGPWTRVDPNAIEREVLAFRDFFKDDLVRRTVEIGVQRMVDVGDIVGDAATAGAVHDWNTKPEATALPPVREATTVRERMSDKPGWMSGVIPAVRTSVTLVFYDDRDPGQRAWLLRTTRAFDDGVIPYIFACGWNSRADMRAFQADHPGLHISAWGDRLAKEWGLTGLPTVITFPDKDSMVTSVGSDPPEPAAAPAPGDR